MFTATKQNNSHASQRFLNPESLLKLVPILPGMVIADFGCGNGYYSVAAGKLAGNKGEVYAVDLLEEALSQTSTLAQLVGVRSITTKQANLENFGSSEISSTSCDLVIMASLLHQVENKENPIREAYRVLKTGGKILVVEWKPESPFGPEVKNRLKVDEVHTLLQDQGFRPFGELAAGAFHFAWVYVK